MKKILTGLAFLCMSTAAVAQYTLIPDPAFENALINQAIDKDGKNGKVLTSSIDKLTSLLLYNSNNDTPIKNLTGIAGFKSLTTLQLNFHALTNFDVSKNIALKELDCQGNQLSSLNVTKNTALITLKCAGNNLSSLDVSKNTVLKHLDCYNNAIVSLDVTKNTALEHFAGETKQSTIDVTKNTHLTYLDMGSGTSALTSLDVSKNTALEVLICSYNKLINLDVSKNTALKSLFCNANKLTSLNLVANTALSVFNCTNNPDLQTICMKTVTQATSNSNFRKDAAASWSETCGVNTDFVDEELDINRNYPNPAITTFTAENAVKLEFINMFGEKVLSSEISTINVESLPAGVYQALITYANGTTQVDKVIKQ